ncbi:MAG: DNA/RNA non-specific endonuclease [Allosphingosinicella sp.]
MSDANPPVRLQHRPRLADMERLGGDEGRLASEAASLEAAGLEAGQGLRISPPSRFAGRTGYDRAFLGEFVVDLPDPKGLAARDVTPVGDDAKGRLDYMHFSVVMSASRRMAMFTAVNISGARSVSIAREGDRWFLDGRIPVEVQLGETIYAGTRLDRGHLVRREDPNWNPEGAEVAEVANADTFHFTNCAPQMDIVNQRTWLGLENYILQNARAWRERVTVFTGPVFGANDLDYRGARIPKAFWKVIAFLTDDGRPSATAYVVEQDEELGMLEAAFGAYKTYQRSVKQIERLSGLAFGTLAQYDGFSNEEADNGLRIAAEIRVLSDIRV